VNDTISYVLKRGWNIDNDGAVVAFIKHPEKAEVVKLLFVGNPVFLF
jgi:hypothetical protein